MQNNYLFIDTETANDNQDICQIGAVIVTNGKIEKDLCLYVKPIEGFQKTYSDIHTITEEDVKDAEPFSKIWQKHFSQYIDNKYVIVAHNASFDLTAIRKTLQHYKIDLPALDYICTQAIAKEKELPGAREDLCKLFGLCIKKSHEALSDVHDCYNIFVALCEKYSLRPKQYIKTHVPQVYDRKEIPRYFFQGEDYTIHATKINCECFYDEIDCDFKDEKIHITGKFEKYPARTKLAEEVRKRGAAHVYSSGGPISKNATMLIIGKKPGKDKLEEATKLNIKIVYEETLYKMLENNDAIKLEDNK